MTHECAAKQMAGFSFGTYLPPLYTQAGAEVTAEHASLVQDHLDRNASGSGAPLLLLEMPPLTYFAFGDLPIPDFFRRMTELTPCGLVLDIGHLWTVYRYTGAWRRRSLSTFLSEFLDVFPLERVVQIHVAGLALHAGDVGTVVNESTSHPPLWIDAHGAPIPEVLWDMLEQVLSHRGLKNLKGIALEVDNKAVSQIVAEFRRFEERFGRDCVESPSCEEGREQGTPADLVHTRRDRSPVESTANELKRSELLRQYRLYARTVSAVNRIELPSLGSERKALDMYRRTYLPHEILHWGGELADMFPLSCARLASAGIPLDSFVAYWFREPRPVEGPYDFFLLKVHRFAGFVREVLPRETDVVDREADELKAAYVAACGDVAPLLTPAASS